MDTPKELHIIQERLAGKIARNAMRKGSQLTFDQSMMLAREAMIRLVNDLEG